MRSVFRAFFVVAAGLVSGAVVAGDCPTRADLDHGFVLIDEERYSSYHVRRLPDQRMWRGARFLSASGTDGYGTRETIFEPQGIVVVETAGSHIAWWTFDADLSALRTLDLNEPFSFEGSVRYRQMDNATGLMTDTFSESGPGRVEFRLRGRKALDIGDCSYVAFTYSALTHKSVRGGDVVKVPGYFTWLPELNVVVDGLWTPLVRMPHKIRKRQPGDWFG